MSDFYRVAKEMGGDEYVGGYPRIGLGEYADYLVAWEALTPEQQQRVREKARWEHASLFCVYHEWHSLFAPGGPVPETQP
jgi:hypothetical protein